MEKVKKNPTRAERQARRKARYDSLRQIPEEKRSAAVKYWLAHEHDEPVELNMRYVLR